MDYPILCTQKELKTLFGIPFCRETLRQKERNGTFPRRARLGSRVVYRVAEILQWIADQIG